MQQEMRAPQHQIKLTTELFQWSIQKSDRDVQYQKEGRFYFSLFVRIDGLARIITVIIRPAYSIFLSLIISKSPPFYFLQTRLRSRSDSGLLSVRTVSVMFGNNTRFVFDEIFVMMTNETYIIC